MAYACMYARLSMSIPSVQHYTIDSARLQFYCRISGSGTVCTRVRSVFTLDRLGSSTYFIHCSSTVHPGDFFPQIPGTFHTEVDVDEQWMNSGRTVDDIHCFLASLKGVWVSVSLPVSDSVNIIHWISFWLWLSWLSLFAILVLFSVNRDAKWKEPSWGGNPPPPLKLRGSSPPMSMMRGFPVLSDEWCSTATSKVAAASRPSPRTAAARHAAAGSSGRNSACESLRLNHWISESRAFRQFKHWSCEHYYRKMYKYWHILSTSKELWVWKP